MQPCAFFRKNYFKISSAKYLVSCLLILSIHNTAFSKERSWRKLFNPVHLNLSIGYGITSYHNTIFGMHMFEKEGKHYLYSSAESNLVYLVRWFDNAYVLLKTYDDPAQLPGATHDEPITITTLKGTGATLPISLSGHVDIFKKFRIELGGSLFINKISTLKPDKDHEHLGDYKAAKSTYYIIRPFTKLGFKLLENSAYTLLLDSHLGFDFTYGRLRDRRAINRSAFPPPVGLGITVEKHIAEYFSVFSSLSYDISSFYKLFAQKQGLVVLKQQGVWIQFGISLNCPEIPRCAVPHCDVEVKHRHGGKAYRGVSMFKGKNARGQRLYEK